MSLFASYCSRCGEPKTSSVLCACQSSFRTSWPVRQGPTTLAALYHEKLAAKDAEIKRFETTLEAVKFYHEHREAAYRAFVGVFDEAFDPYGHEAGMLLDSENIDMIEKAREQLTREIE